jgi:hypothetical protein
MHAELLSPSLNNLSVNCQTRYLDHLHLSLYVNATYIEFEILAHHFNPTQARLHLHMILRNDRNFLQLSSANVKCDLSLFFFFKYF